MPENRGTLKQFNMDKLEQEYDYDTDDEQLFAAKAMLYREACDAIHFVAQEGDPLQLVDNLCYQNKRVRKK